MNLKEAFQALAEGKKIRKKNWGNNEYIFVDGMTLKNEDGTNGFLLDFHDTGADWEIYEEYNMSFIEALTLMDKDRGIVCESSLKHLYRINYDGSFEMRFFNSCSNDYDEFENSWDSLNSLSKLKFRKV